ncbi:MAG: recombination protein RecR, partial [Lentisphaerae bacterium]
MVKRNSADTLHPEAVHRLSQFLGKLPGIGRKSAQRLAYELLSWERTELKAFGELLQELPSLVHRCQRCGIFSDSQVCSLCRDPERDSSLICVVEDIREVVALEQAETFRGTYHILGGKLSPLDGVGPEQLRIAQLLERVQTGEVREIILALSSDVEGEATAAY